jgi:hypothetical protein
MIVPVPQPQGIGFPDFAEALYAAYYAARFPAGSIGPGRVLKVEPLIFEDASPDVRAAWTAVGNKALELAPQVRAATGPNAMYQQ